MKSVSNKDYNIKSEQKQYKHLEVNYVDINVEKCYIIHDEIYELFNKY